MSDRLAVALAAALAVLQAGLLAATAWDKSDTPDEPLYIATGIQQWVLGSYTYNCESPALPKWGFALGIRLAYPGVFDRVSDDVRVLPDPLFTRPKRLRRNLFSARLATIAVTVAGGLFLWGAARGFGAGPALAAHALWCFSPTILAHGSLATLDAWAASFACVALWATLSLAHRPAFWRLGVAGAAAGAAAASKVTALGLAPIALGVGAWALARRGPGGARRAWRLFDAAAVFALAFLLLLWAAYGFSAGTVDTGDLCGRRKAFGHLVLGPLPFPAWIEGVLLQVLHGGRGHLGYLYGEVSRTGWWWFYLAAIALKTTLGAQLLVALRLASWAKRPPSRRELLVDLGLLAYPLLLLLVMSLGNAQNGIKYLLPAFPFVMLFAARGVADLGRAFGGAGLGAAALALLLGAGETLSVHPHHLMFFNLWAGGPEGGPRYLIHGDDWGQDQRRLAEWQRAHRVPRKDFFYTYYDGDPEAWGVQYRRPRCVPTPGVYALHAVEVHRPKHLRAGCLDWLTIEPPDERIGYSIYIYRVDEARLARLARERGRVEPFWQGARGAGPAAQGPEEPERP